MIVSFYHIQLGFHVAGPVEKVLDNVCKFRFIKILAHLVYDVILFNNKDKIDFKLISNLFVCTILIQFTSKNLN